MSWRSVTVKGFTTWPGAREGTGGRRGSHAGRALEGLSKNRSVPRRLRAFILDLPDHLQYRHVAAKNVEAGARSPAAGTESRRRGRKPPRHPPACRLVEHAG